jgi:hypothetical protein
MKEKTWRQSFILSLVLLAMSLVINFYAGSYANTVASNYVTDIILSNIPSFDVDWLFINGAYFLVFCIALVCFRNPERTPFAVKAIAVFYVIRSLFIMLTHIAPFPSHTIIDPLSMMRIFNFDGQLFFSGHVGLPFLMALIFWDKKPWRLFFVALSIVFGIIVLLGHLHYSIDVFAAFFITYGIYHLATLFFRHDTFRDNQ